MIYDVRGNAIRAIEHDMVEFNSQTRWGGKPNREVIKMGTKFCEELLEYAKTSDFEDKVHCTGLFSSVALILIAGTRDFDVMSEEELEAMSKIFDDLRAIWADFLEKDTFEKMFDRIMYVREIFLTNAVCREDYDCKYRQSMIFPNFVDLYEIEHKIETNWDKFKASTDSTYMFMSFRQEWYSTHVRCRGDICMEKAGLSTAYRPKNLPEEIDPRAKAREFLRMIDKVIDR